MITCKINLNIQHKLKVSVSHDHYFKMQFLKHSWFLLALYWSIRHQFLRSPIKLKISILGSGSFLELAQCYLQRSNSFLNLSFTTLPVWLSFQSYFGKVIQLFNILISLMVPTTTKIIQKLENLWLLICNWWE